jgi:phage shock protein E
MEWTLALVPVVLVAAFFLVKRMSFVTAETARQHLAQGALVIDVRSPEEFRSDRVPGAINIPLGELRENLPQEVKDKNQVLLLHCLSGGRSAIAQQQLRSMGYINVFNLGSLARAKRIACGIDPLSAD